jgi:hypothetical protein
MGSMNTSDTMTLKEARDALRAEIDDGAHCPCCTQFAKVYKRKITASQLRTAGLVYAKQNKQPGDDPWVHLPSIPQHSRDFATLAYFGIAEQKPGKREDGGAAGYWKITNLGAAFLRGNGFVRKYARVFDGRLLGFDGAAVSVTDLAPKFRLDELMAGA